MVLFFDVFSWSPPCGIQASGRHDVPLGAPGAQGSRTLHCFSFVKLHIMNVYNVVGLELSIHPRTCAVTVMSGDKKS